MEKLKEALLLIDEARAELRADGFVVSFDLSIVHASGLLRYEKKSKEVER